MTTPFNHGVSYSFTCYNATIMASATLTQTPRPSSHRALLLAFPFLLLAILFLDSKGLAARFGSGQRLANLFTGGFFLWMLRGASA